MSDDEAALVCSRTRGRTSAPVPGSARRLCALCDAEVFVSPSSLSILNRSPGMTIVCVPCAVQLPPPDRVAPLTPAQLREIIDRLKEEP